MKIITKIKNLIGMILFAILMRVVSVFLRLKNNRVLFLSDVRDVLDGNLKFVYDNISDEKCEKIVVLKADRSAKRNIKERIKVIYYLATSKYIILDDFSRLITLMKKKKEQEICQLWHGAGAFKKFGYSRQEKEQRRKSKLGGHKNYTKVPVTAEKIRWCYAEGFGTDIDNVKATGMARTDIFFDKKYIQSKKNELYDKYPYLKNKKVILFAPTYRGVSLRKAYYDYDKLDVEEIYNKLSDKGYVFLFKWHPGLYYKMKTNDEIPYDLEKYKDFYHDISELRDINELLLITDILITDYSSVIFDYALLNKPLVYFLYDYEQYSNDRGLYFQLDDYIYGDIAKNIEELIKKIEGAKVKSAKRKEFIDKFMGACDGNSTKKTCEWIFEDNIEFINK